MWPASEPAAAPSDDAQRPDRSRPVATPVGFWRRTWAFLVDSLLLWFPLSILKVTSGLPLLDTDLTREADGRDLGLFIASCLLHWLYTAWLDASKSQGTLGKQLLGIRVEHVAGGRLSFVRASVRQVASWLSFLAFGLGFLMCVWTKRRQTLHDMLAGAVLVRWEEPSASGPRPSA